MQNELCDLVIVDVETSGYFVRQGHEIIEVAAMRFDPRTMLPRVGCVDLKVRPKNGVPPDVARGNGYSEEAWADAVSIEEAMEALGPMLVGAKWTGQNPAFDREFCQVSMERAEMPWPKLGDYHMLDVGSLAYPLALEGTVPSESQRYLMKLFGLGEQEHRAMSDVRHSAEILSRLLNAARYGYRTTGVCALGPIAATAKTAFGPAPAVHKKLS